MAAVIILLGIFLGSVYSFSAHTRKFQLSPHIEEEYEMSGVRGGSKIKAASDQLNMTPPPLLEAPTEDDGHMDLNYDIEEVYDGNRKLGQEGTTSASTVVAGGISRIDVEPDGITATYPEIGKRYYYENFVPAIIVVDGDSSAREIASDLGAVIADEFSAKVLIFIPEGSESALETLVIDGMISSYEFGGWGTGLGKT